MTGTDHTPAPTTSTPIAATATGRITRSTAPPTPQAPPALSALSAPDGTTADSGPRPRPAVAPGTVPAVPRPRRSPADRRPLGPAGSGPGASGRGPASSGRSGPAGPAGRGSSGGRGPGPAGRGPTRTTPRLAHPSAAAAAAESRRIRTGTPVDAAGTPLPTAGARQRAHESRPHHWFAQQLVLALSGQRPVHALLGHALPAAYDRLAELAPQAPLRPATGPGRHGPAPTVRDCGLCRPRRGVIEAFARIAAGERLRALAFRLELGADSRWRCAALDIGPTPALRCAAS
ncbi:Rv3235 family protein [Streptomyces platensis]|uniref:Rv3235 family protein n=1 Tax=Streptomyces platensis TaxID=58346 RepID=UPI0022567125|nr:Rv3235 family protein [Streptomyces platensis]MCX4634715.1 Rv3235 family protein [Streptomyces platensis]